VMAKEFPEVEVKTQILVGKPFQVILQWAEEIKPTLLVAARHVSATLGRPLATKVGQAGGWRLP